MNDNPSIKMNEQRMVTLILCVMLALGSVGLVAVYFIISGGHGLEHGSQAIHKVEAEPSNSIAAGPSLSQVPGSESTVISLAGETVKKESTGTKDQSKNGSWNSSAAQEESELSNLRSEEPPSSRVFQSTDPVEIVANTSKEEDVSMTQPQVPLQVTTYETSKDNGTFYSAQEITESVIVGKRGSAGDRADYFKVRATGRTMILKLEPSLQEERYPLTIIVFNAEQKSIVRSSGETDPAISLSVTPKDTYYIKLNLSRAPIEKPQYQLNLRFQ